MSQPPQGGSEPRGEQPSQGQGPRGSGPQGPGPQGYPPQGYPPQPPYPPQGYPQQGLPGQSYAPQSYPPPQGRPGQPPYPPPGYPQAQPSGQPYGPGYGPGPAGPQSFQPGPSALQQPEHKKRTGLFVLIGAGALALILAVVAVAVNLGGTGESAAGGTAGGTTTNGGRSTSSAPAAAASDAVSGFLGALVQQDAQKALSYAADPNLDTALMTRKVLAASAKLAPIGNVSVPAVTDKNATSVAATYTLGSTPVSATYDVVKVGDDWKISQIAATVDVSVVMDSSIPMRVNGVRVRSGSLTLLPGAYRFTTGQRNYDYGRHPNLLVQTPSDAPDASRLRPGISSKGRDSALRAVRASWSRCLKSDDPKPKGCPNRWTNGKYAFKKGSVDWTRKGSDPVKKPQSQVGFSSVTYRVKVDLTLKGRCTYKGQTGSCSGSLTGTALARVAVSATKVTVTWL